MRRILLFAFLFSVLFAGAQDKPNFGKCEALFTYEVNHSVMSVLPATAIVFQDRSTGNVNQWFWDFGDGNTSREQNPTFVFTYPVVDNVKINPYRTVTLTILTSDSCKSMFSQTINIMGSDSVVYPDYCKAQFKYYQSHYDSLAHTATVQLNNYSEGEELTYLWQFDEGKTSTEKEPQVTFDLSQRERKVCLTVTGKNGCTDTYCDAVYLYDPFIKVDTIYPEPVKCETAFGYSVNYDVKTFAPALVLDFYSKAYPEAIEWKWDFGDGTTSTEANPMHIFNLPLHKDSLSADYIPYRKVCLTVKTIDGCEATYCETIDLYMNTTPVDPTPQCHAWIKYYRVTDVVSIPEVVVYQLADRSEGKVIARKWLFEDGTTSTEAEPQVSFSIFKPTQKVQLTIYTEDDCSSSWSEIIYVEGSVPSDSIYLDEPTDAYSMKYESFFPEYMSSCAGWAKAQVYRNGEPVNATDYVWSSGATGQEAKRLCPTQTYTVKAITPDGTYVSGTFRFNSDGSVTEEKPLNWWVVGEGDNSLVKCEPASKDYTVEWKLCDGTLVESDSINLNRINCGGNESNMMVKDAAGNVVYSELISAKSLTTGFNPVKKGPVKIYPNPVVDVLTIQYSGRALNDLQVEIWDVAGRQVSVQKFRDVQSGEQISMNVSSLNKGLYVCKIISGQKVIRTEKFNK